MVKIFLEVVCPLIGNILSVCMLVSPITAVMKIRREGKVGVSGTRQAFCSTSNEPGVSRLVRYTASWHTYVACAICSLSTFFPSHSPPSTVLGKGAARVYLP